MFLGNPARDGLIWRSGRDGCRAAEQGRPMNPAIRKLNDHCNLTITFCRVPVNLNGG